MNTLYLTPSERAVFGALSAALQDGWIVSEEKGSFTDSPQQRQLRLRTYRAYDPSLVVLKDAIVQATTPEKVEAFLASINLAELTDDALMDLFYTLGPDSLTLLIQQILGKATADDDVLHVAAFSVIRHNLLAALASSPL